MFEQVKIGTAAERFCSTAYSSFIQPAPIVLRINPREAKHSRSYGMAERKILESR